MKDPLATKLEQMEKLLSAEEAALVAHDSQQVAQLAQDKAALVLEMDGMVDSWRASLKHPELPADVIMTNLVERVEAQNRLNGSLIEDYLHTLHARLNSLHMAAAAAAGEGQSGQALYDSVGATQVNTTGSRAYAQA